MYLHLFVNINGLEIRSLQSFYDLVNDHWKIKYLYSPVQYYSYIVSLIAIY